MTKAAEVKTGDIVELTFQHEGEFITDWCRVLEVSDTVTGHLTFRVLSEAASIYQKIDFMHEDELNTK